MTEDMPEDVKAAAKAESPADRAYIECDCATPYHFLRVEPDPDIDGMLNLAFVSTRNGSFWHRLRWALAHVFGRDDLVFADIIVSRKRIAAAIRGDGNGEG